MAIKQGTQEKIASRLGNIADWQCFGVYEYAYQCRTCVCGHCIATSFVLIRKGDHGPAFGDSVELGSECIKFVKALSPEFFEWMMTKKAEMDRIKRKMKKMREDEFRASDEWFHLENRMMAATEILSLMRGFNMGVLTRMGIDAKNMKCRWSAETEMKCVDNIHHGKLKFEDGVTAERYISSMEVVAKRIVAELEPHRDLLQAFVDTSYSSIPGHRGCKAVLEAL